MLFVRTVMYIQVWGMIVYGYTIHGILIYTHGHVETDLGV